MPCIRCLNQCTSVDHRIERIQALVRKYNPKGERLSENLIRDRRAEDTKH